MKLRIGVIRNQAGIALTSLLKRQGYSLIRTDHLEFPPDLDEEFRAHYDACRPFTLTSSERMYALYNAVRYVVKAGIPGDFVECGVWKGGSAMLMARVLMALGVTDRHLYLYDTFQGMTEPSTHDGAGARARWHQMRRDDHNEWCYAPLDEVKNNMMSTGYPSDHVHFVVGSVEDTIPSDRPAAVALLRLDTDWYESTRHELVHMYPRLTTGGPLIIDDYGHWEGARKAVDEYFAHHGPIILHRADRTGRITLKP